PRFVSGGQETERHVADRQARTPDRDHVVGNLRTRGISAHARASLRQYGASEVSTRRRRRFLCSPASGQLALVPTRAGTVSSSCAPSLVTRIITRWLRPTVRGYPRWKRRPSTSCERGT